MGSCRQLLNDGPAETGSVLLHKLSLLVSWLALSPRALSLDAQRRQATLDS